MSNIRIFIESEEEKLVNNPISQSIGVKIVIDDNILTKINNGGSDFLGTMAEHSWFDMAEAFISLSDSTSSEFEIITEGWDPKFSLEKEDSNLRIKIKEESRVWKNSAMLPEEYTEGFKISFENFADELVKTGIKMINYWDREFENEHEEVERIEDKIAEIKRTVKEIEN